MNTKCTKNLKQVILVFIVMAMIAAPSFAVEFDLVAKKFTTVMPDGATINMWGFALDTGQACTEDPGWDVGPKFQVNPGDGLIVNLRNCLAEPVSIVIPGQKMPSVSTGSAPVRHSSGPLTGRVRSFTGEADPNGGTATYTWVQLDPGTYLYHSGTHPQIQVQMGLYGPVSKDANAGEGYVGVAYDKQLDLLFSEIDPVLHNAVANGTYGTTGPTSTLDYQPKYFLINGEPHTSSSPCEFADGSFLPGERLLLRMMNAALRELAPLMIGSHFEVVAEAGKKYQFPYTQYSLLLQPGSTKDAVFTPLLPGNYPILDRRLSLTNNTSTGGGMQTCLTVGVSTLNNPPLIGSTAVITGTIGALYTYDVDATDPDAGDTLTFSLDLAPVGMTIDSTSGLIQWTPQANQSGNNNVTVRVTDSGTPAAFATQAFTINITGQPPTITSTAITSGGIGVLYTDTVTASDPDQAFGEILTFSLDVAPVGMTINPVTGLILWTPLPSQTGDNNVTVRVTDLSGLFATQSFTITVSSVVTAPAALYYFSTSGNTTVPGVAPPYDDADIYSWNGTTIARLFDASAAGLGGNADVDAIQVNGDRIYMSFTRNGGVAVPGLGTVQDEDIVAYNLTAHTWSMYFNGSDVGLDTKNEDVDAFEILVDGSVVVSTLGAGSVTGIGSIQDEDLISCVGTFGPTTTCAWSVYFDGSDVALTARSEDIDSVGLAAGNIYLSTTGNYAVPGLSGGRDDVFACLAPVTGDATSCSDFSISFDSSALGIPDIDAIDMP